MGLILEKFDLVSKIINRNSIWKPGVLAHACNPSTQEAEVRGSQILGQPRTTQ
jgi:hypothetical protein